MEEVPMRQPDQVDRYARLTHSHSGATIRDSASWRVMLTLGLLLLVAIVASCGDGASSPRSSSYPDFNSSVVFLASSVSYAQALRLITDLGLQPGIDCGAFVGSGRAAWQPMGQRETFTRDARLVVWPARRPDGWGKRLQASPGVLAVQGGYPLYSGVPTMSPLTQQVPYSCPPPIDGLTPPAMTPVAMSNGMADVEIYARIAFGSPALAYDDALYTVSNLGLALADVCYDQALARVGRTAWPPWHPMGQEQSYAASGTLLVGTVRNITSSLWREELLSAPGVVSFEAPYPAKC
jgi:hypothetical protein